MKPVYKITIAVLFAALLIGGYFIADSDFIALKQNDSSLHQVSEDVLKGFEADFVQLSRMERAGMPDIEVLGLDGPLNLRDLSQGTVTLVNFWATWCAPCITELPLLEALDEKYEDLQVIAISLDGFDDPEVLKTYLTDKNIGLFAAYSDTNKRIQSAMALRGLPTSILLDAKGRAHYAFMGDANWVSQEAKAFFDAALGS